MSGCWTIATTKATALTVGAPVVDTVARRVYMLTGVGVLGGLFAGPTPKITVKPLAPLLSFKLQNPGQGLRTLVLDNQRQLFVADGPLVRRVRLAKTGPGKVSHRPFHAGRSKERARNLSISGDGSLLEVFRDRSGTLHSVAGVCLKRCSGCICK